MRYHAAGSHDRVPADRDAAQNGGTGSNRRPAHHPGRHDLPVRFGLGHAAGRNCAGVLVIDERYVVTNETVVFDLDALTDKRVA